MEFDDALECISGNKGAEYSWPPPPKASKTYVDGELAERVRLAFDADDEALVELTQTETVTGYSEYTSWTEYDFTITCEGHSWSVSEDTNQGLRELLEWLDENTEQITIKSKWVRK